MCNKNLYQTPPYFSRKKLCKMTQFTCSITLGFVIPNSSNHCIHQCKFIMYSCICMIFYFCMHQIFLVTPSAWPVFPPTTQKTPPHHTQSCRCRISVRPSCGQGRRSVIWQPLWFWHLPPCCKLGWNWMWVWVWLVLWESFYWSLANGMNCKLE